MSTQTRKSKKGTTSSHMTMLSIMIHLHYQYYSFGFSVSSSSLPFPTQLDTYDTTTKHLERLPPNHVHLLEYFHQTLSSITNSVCCFVSFPFTHSTPTQLLRHSRTSMDRNVQYLESNALEHSTTTHQSHLKYHDQQQFDSSSIQKPSLEPIINQHSQTHFSKTHNSLTFQITFTNSRILRSIIYHFALWFHKTII